MKLFRNFNFENEAGPGVLQSGLQHTYDMRENQRHKAQVLEAFDILEGCKFVEGCIQALQVPTSFSICVIFHFRNALLKP